MLSAALSAMTKRIQHATWNAWRDQMDQRTRKHDLLQRAVSRLQSSLLARVSPIRMPV